MSRNWPITRLQVRANNENSGNAPPVHPSSQKLSLAQLLRACMWNLASQTWNSARSTINPFCPSAGHILITNRKYLRFELSIWSILDIDTGQLNQHLKFLVHVKTNTGICTVSIPFPCFLPELQLCLSLITDLYQMATDSNIITSIVCYFHYIALFIHMQGLQHWPVSLLQPASSCAVSDIVPMNCTSYGCVVCKTPVMPHLQYSHRHLLQIMQLLAMLFLEWTRRCFQRCSDSDGYVLPYSGFR